MALGSLGWTLTFLNLMVSVELSRTCLSRLCTAEGSGSQSPSCTSWAKMKSSRLAASASW